MRIEYIKCDVTEIIRNTKLMKSDVQPYLNSDINYRVDFPESIFPCQNYVLFKQLKVIEQIDRHCYDNRIRINNLHGYLIIHTDEGSFTFTPPIIELDTFSNEPRYIINDGMHRMYYFKEYTTDPCRMIVIENPSCPYYAYPTEWDNVQLLHNHIPQNFKKKSHRVKEYKKLYRDFNTAFEHHVGAPRGKG